MGKIKELPSSSSHLLSCTQVITSINCVVKELVENAIDSCSKNIEVKLEDYGLDKIEVKDCGSGIHKDDISKVAKPHCTSKITSHLDLNQVQTYGFRGEALSALCALSDLSIITKTSEEEFGFSYTFDHKGNVASSKPSPSTQGTTISAANLFKKVPVRRQYYRTDKTKKEELKKVEDTLIAFGCIHPDLRLALFHNQSLIWQKPTVKTIRDGLVSIFGNFIVDYMLNCEFTDEKSRINIEVFLPKANSPPMCSSISPNRSIISINNRPVRMKSIDKVLKEYFNKSQNFSKYRYPICYIAIKVPPSETDVNVEPNKTTVLLNNSDAVIEQLSAILKTFYDNPISEIGDKGGPTLSNSENSSNTSNRNSDANNLSFDINLKKSDINVISSPLLTPEILKPKNKCLSRKLSRQSDGVSTPANKKMRSSNISCTNPNEISRHLKTLDSFLQSSETSAVEKPNQLSLFDENSNCSLMQKEAMRPKQSGLFSDLNITNIPQQEQSAQNKKMRSSNISCTNPIETSRHLKTLDSYLQSSETSAVEKPNQVSLFDENSNCSLIQKEVMRPEQSGLFSDLNITNIPHQEQSAENNDIKKNSLMSKIISLQAQAAQNIDVRKNSPMNNDSNILSSHISMTVERKNLEQLNSSELLLDILNENSLNFEENEITCVSKGVIDNCSKHFEKNSELATEECLTIIPESSEENKITSPNRNEQFKTAKSILECNEALNNQQYSTSNNKQSNINFPKENCINQNNNCLNDELDENWSRGKHLNDDIQPVTVLKPQVVKNIESLKKSPVLKERNDKRQSPEIVTNQRKMTAFDFFCRKHRLEIAAVHPQLNNNQLAHILSEKWNHLTSDEKAIYKAMVDKDYPKNIKNKDKLGKCVSQNLNKGKEIGKRPKKKAKRKHPEKTIPFDVELSKNFTSINSCKVDSEEINVINCISPGIWIYSQEDKILILNTFRLQEIIIYQRLLETFKFEPEPLEFPCIVSSNSLGEEALEMIIRLYNDGNYLDKELLDERITANGFKINVIKNNEEAHIQITGMTKNLAFYGVLDLKEILKILKEKGTSSKLSECRPEKVKLYLQSEAVRMARQCPPCSKFEFVKDLLKKMKCLPPNCNECIHSKPFIHEMYKIS